MARKIWIGISRSEGEKEKNEGSEGGGGEKGGKGVGEGREDALFLVNASTSTMYEYAVLESRQAEFIPECLSSIQIALKYSSSFLWDLSISSRFSGSF